MVRTAKRPPADLLDGHGSHQINGNTLAMRRGELRARAAAVNGIGAPVANYVIGFAFDQFQIEGNDFASNAAEAIHIRHFPATEIIDFRLGEVFLVVFGGIVDPMP